MLSFGSMLSLVSMIKAVEVHSLGDTTVIFVLCLIQSVWIYKVVTDVYNFQEEIFFTLGKVQAMESVLDKPII